MQGAIQAVINPVHPGSALNASCIIDIQQALAVTSHPDTWDMLRSQRGGGEWMCACRSDSSKRVHGMHTMLHILRNWNNWG